MSESKEHTQNLLLVSLISPFFSKSEIFQAASLKECFDLNLTFPNRNSFSTGTVVLWSRPLQVSCERVQLECLFRLHNAGEVLQNLFENFVLKMSPDEIAPGGKGLPVLLW